MKLRVKVEQLQVGDILLPTMRIVTVAPHKSIRVQAHQRALVLNGHINSVFNARTVVSIDRDQCCPNKLRENLSVLPKSNHQCQLPKGHGGPHRSQWGREWGWK